MADSTGERRLYVWDTEHRLWHCENDPGVMQMVWHDGLYALCRDGALVLLGDSVPAPENAEREQVVESMAEFADVDGRSFDAQYPVRLRLRLEAEEDAAVQAEIMYDSSGKWEAAGSCPAGQSKRSVYLPLPIRRCDHFRLRLRGTGLWKLHALETEYYNGSYPRK